jgi:transposase-like protein
MAKAGQLERREEWQQRVAAFKASGKSGAAWCAEHGIKLHQLYYWVQRLAPSTERGINSLPQTSWVPVEVDDHRPSPQGKGPKLRIGSAAIYVQPGFDEKLLRDVVRC